MGELTRGKLIAAACGLALLVLMSLFSWFDTSSIGGGDYSATAYAAGVDTTLNAWQAFGFIDLILLLAAIAAVGAAVLSAGGAGARAPVAPELVVLGLGALSSLLLFYRILTPVLDAGRKLGLFLGFLAAVGIAVGAWLALQENAAAAQPRRRRVPRSPSSPV